MLVPLDTFSWQVLRYVVRSAAAGKPAVPGRELRLVPSRRTKDGRFLGWFTAAGLLKLVKGSEEEPFEATYRLTLDGVNAAEYGEFECDTPTLALLSANRAATLRAREVPSA